MMNKIKKAIKSATPIIKLTLACLWQLPQLWMGIMLWVFYKKPKSYTYINAIVFPCSIPGAISLGYLIFVNYKQNNDETINHEYGHVIQSAWLGPFYLIVVGIPSILHAAFHKCKNYYHFFTEKNANDIH